MDKEKSPFRIMSRVVVSTESLIIALNNELHYGFPTQITIWITTKAIPFPL